jgi:PAS domain S-box-containing protein
LVAGAAATLANAVFGTVLAGDSLADWIAIGGGAGSSAILGIGLLVGYLRGTRLTLEKELVARLAIQLNLARLSHLNESILRSVGDGIIAVNAMGHVVSINPASERMLGVDAETATGRLASEMFRPPRTDGRAPMALEDLVSDVLADGVERNVEGEEITRTDGTAFIGDRIVAPLREASGGEVVGVVMALRDTTERAAIERGKSEFLTMTSHELRTPLTAIHAVLGLAAGGVLGELPEKVSELLSVAAQNSQRLLKLVNEIIELEQMNLGSTTLTLAPVAAKELLEETVAGIGPLAGEAGVTISVHGGDVVVEADRARIVQTLTNLVGNAIKFSPIGGEITLSCRTVVDEVEFDVHDSGPGIALEEAKRIFEPFAQVNLSDASVLGGTGLGLAISKGIVAQHRGRIWVASELGHGSSFMFALPLKHPQT